MELTVSQLKAYPQFATLADQVILDAIDDAQAEVAQWVSLPPKAAERATRLFACHLLTAEKVAASGVQSFTIGPITKTKVDYSKIHDRYIEGYLRLLRQYGLDSSQGRAWSSD